MLDFAHKLTTTPWLIEEPDREALRQTGLTNGDIFDLAETVGFYNLSNRMAVTTDMMPNPEYHRADRGTPYTPPPQPARAKPPKQP
jgi:uncharacterized protein YciW